MKNTPTHLLSYAYVTHRHSYPSSMHDVCHMNLQQFDGLSSHESPVAQW